MMSTRNKFLYMRLTLLGLLMSLIMRIKDGRCVRSARSKTALKITEYTMSGTLLSSYNIIKKWFFNTAHNPHKTNLWSNSKKPEDMFNFFWTIGNISIDHIIHVMILSSWHLPLLKFWCNVIEGSKTLELAKWHGNIVKATVLGLPSKLNKGHHKIILAIGKILKLLILALTCISYI